MTGSVEALARAIVRNDWKWPPRGAYLDLFGEALPECVTGMGEVVAALRARATRRLASYGYRVGDGGALEPVTDAEKARALEEEKSTVETEAPRDLGPFRWMGGEWYKGKKDEQDVLGPKDRMKAVAARLGHKALLQAERQGRKGFYNVFGSYPDWTTTVAEL
jgi:hypothetical protein